MYEVIVVNDGTKDQSMDIVKNYDVKVINQENQGLSGARNTGAKEAKGEYIIFLDSDDWIENNLLEEISKALEDNPDLVRFQIRKVFEKKDSIDYPEEAFDTCNGVEAFEKICKYHFVEIACSYCIKRSYYEKNHFEFAKGMIHEDFGLMPLVIIKASKVKSISTIGYNYRQRENSIMSNTNYDRIKKRVNDFLKHYTYLMTEINKTKLDGTYFRSFIANSLILKITELNDEDYKEYKKILKEEKVYDFILADTLKRKIKKVLLKISPKMVYRKK